MSLLLRFPFRWGAPASTSTAVVVVPAIPFWTRTAVASQQWLVEDRPVLPRFEHIFPEADTGPGWEKVTNVIG